MKTIETKESRAMVLFMLMTIALYFVVYKIVEMIIGEIPQHIGSRIMEGVGIVLLLFFLKFTPFTIQRSGMVASKAEIKRTLIRCGLICIFIIAAMIGARIVMTQFKPEMANRPWFKPYFGMHMRWLYPFTAILQEFISKAVMQDNLKRLVGDDKPVWGILVTSLLFMVMHSTCPLYYMLGAGALCVVTGFIYEKDKSIWGCILIHFCIGFLPRALGLK